MATSIGELIVQLGVDASALHKGLDDASVKFQKFGSDLSTAGRNLSLTVTAPIVAVGIGAIKAAADWETAMTMVAKTVDEPATEIARLGREFIALSEAIPVSATELAHIGEMAGQLGIETDNILGFTRVIADIGVTTNLTADQAADAFARIANITGMAETDFDRLGSTIVDLGNKGASTEAEIVDFGLRIAGAGSIAGLTVPQILAIGAAMSSVGIEAEAGGTAVQKVLLGMTESVATGNEHLQVFAATAGVSAAEFARLFREDAAGAFALFVTGLGEQGQDAFQTLEQLDLQDQRLIRSFLSLAGAGDLLNQQLAIGTTAWEENTALTVEAEKFYGTLANQFVSLKNQIMNTAAELGTALRPALDKLMDAARPVLDWIGDAVSWFAKLDPRIQATAIAVVAAVAAIGPLLVVGGLLVTTIGSLIPVVTAVAGAIGAVSAPVIAAIAVLGALVAAVITAYKTSETFRTVVNEVFQEVLETIRPIMEEIRETVLKILTEIQAFWAEHGESIMAIVMPALEALGTLIGGFMKTIGEAIKFVLNVIQGDWAEAHGNLLAANEIFKETMVKVFTILRDLVIAIVKAMWEEIKQQFRDAIEAIKNEVGEFVEGIKDKFKALADAITFGSIWPEMWDSVAQQTDEWTGKITGLLDDWKGGLLDIFDDLSGGIIGKVTDMWETVTGIIDDVTRIIDDVSEILGGGAATGGVVGVGGTATGLSVGIGIPTIGGGGVVGVSGTAGGLSTGAGIPTIGGTGAAGGLAAQVAGAALPLVSVLAIKSLVDWLNPADWLDDVAVTFEKGGYAREMQDRDTEWREMIANSTPFGERILPGGYDITLEVDGQRLGSIAMKYGVDGIRQRTGIEAY